MPNALGVNERVFLLVIVVKIGNRWAHTSELNVQEMLSMQENFCWSL